jgi:Lon protease-like protein
MDVFIFPLPQFVLQPGTQRPLNIFEKRYIAMVQEAVKTKTPIALAYGLYDYEDDCLAIQHESLPYIKRIAGFGEVEILQKKSDGTLVVLIKAAGKILIDQTTLKQEFGFLQGSGEVISENHIITDENQFMYKRLKTLLSQKLKNTIKNQQQIDIIMADIKSPEKVTNFYAEFVVHDAQVKQQVLENDLDEKVKILSHYNVSHPSSEMHHS